MHCIMRATISLDDHLGRQVRRRAADEGLSVNAFISKALEDSPRPRAPSERPLFRLVTMRNARLLPEVDLDAPRSLDVEDGRARLGR